MQLEVRDARYQSCYYKRKGDGYPVVFLHGFGEDHRIWDTQMSMEENFMCIYPDFPGCGLSTALHGEWAIEGMADYVISILDQEGIEEAIIFGHSMGGYVALALADLFPKRISALGLIHSTAYADDAQKIENRLKSIRLIEGNGKEVFLKAMIPNLYSEASRERIPAVVQQHLTNALEISSEVLIQYYKVMIIRPDRTTVLQHTKVPVLFVIGTDDAAVPYDQSIQQASLPNVANVEVFQGIGHTAMNECPDQLLTILNKFCNNALNLKKM